MPIDSLPPAQAQEAMSQDDGCAFVDVRTVEEFDRGHPAGAVNVPWAVMDPAAGGMAPNPSFVPTMEKLFGKDKKLYLSCQGGVRSMNACRELEQAGFNALVNVECGFGGQRDPMGNLVAPGWVDSGLPVEDTPSDYEQVKA